jgi:hypothetical protein
MDAARKLLQAGPQSEIARVARGGLIGLCAMLEDALARCPPDDAALAPAKDLLAHLRDLVAGPEPGGLPASDPAGAQPGAPAGPRSAPAPGPAPPGSAAGPTGPMAGDQALSALAAALAAEPALAECLDQRSLAGLRSPAGAGPDPVGGGQAADGALWRAVHLCLLRLPEQVSADWGRRAAELAAAAPGEAHWRTLPAESAAVLVPPRGPATEGIRTSPHASLDAGVVTAVSPAREWPPGPAADLAELARVSSLVLGLAPVDDNLVLCLESVLFQGSRRLDDKLRELYRADLLARLREYARRPPGSVDALAALIEVDEAINSLTHRPPAVPGSWWAQVRQQPRRMATRAAAALRDGGADVEVLPLGLRYTDVRDLTRGNDVASRTGGKPGDVLACLRLWARMDGKTMPGRVIYRT